MEVSAPQPRTAAAPGLGTAKEAGRELVATLLWREVCRLTSESPSAAVEEGRLLSQVVSSSGFLRLLLATEKALGVVVDDEDLYEAAPVTLGDLIDFLAAKAARGNAG